MKSLYIIFCLLISILYSSGGFAASTRSVDADQFQSSDHTKTFSVPAASDTLVGRASTDTLTNKTISGSSNTLSNLPIATQYNRDSFSGNGSTTAFTLTNTPGAVAEVAVYIDGILQIVTTDYSISGTTLTFTSAPATGQDIKAIYSRF